MKVAVIFSIPNTTSGDVYWRWRSMDGKTDSTQPFNSREECLQNAETSGYLYHYIPGSSGNPPDTRRAGRTRTSKR